MAEQVVPATLINGASADEATSNGIETNGVKANGTVIHIENIDTKAVNGATNEPLDAKATLEKYEEERQKRLRSDGLGQFIISPVSEEYRGFYTDPWVDDSVVDPGSNSIVDGSRCEILILGAGYGGLLMAARLIQAGVDVNDIRLVDTAGGFGGTWWYNRYVPQQATESIN